MLSSMVFWESGVLHISCDQRGRLSPVIPSVPTLKLTGSPDYLRHSPTLSILTKGFVKVDPAVSAHETDLDQIATHCHMEDILGCHTVPYGRHSMTQHFLSKGIKESQLPHHIVDRHIMILRFLKTGPNKETEHFLRHLTV